MPARIGARRAMNFGAISLGAGGGGAIPFPTSLASIAVIGDSIVAGSNATATGNRWVNLLVAAVGATLTNLGVPGSVMQNTNGSGGAPLTDPAETRISGGALTGANKKAHAIIASGFNDGRYTAEPNNFNVANYYRALRASVAFLLANGYAASDITIVTPHYITDTGLVTGSGGFSGQSRAGFERFLQAARTVAAEAGVYLADTYAYMRDNGGSSLIDAADNIHPNDAGHAAIRTAVLAATRRAAMGDVTAPTILSPTASSVAAGSAFSMTLQATEPVTWAKTGGAGASSFTLTNGVLSAPNNLTAGTYSVTLTATDAAGLASSFTYTLTVVAAAAGVFMSDTFTDVDGTAITAHTGEVGATWALQSGSNPSGPDLIAANRVYCQSTAAIYYASGAAADGNMEVKGTFDRLSSLGTDRIAITARASASANTFYWFGYDEGTGYRLFSQVNGTQTQIGSTVSATWSSGVTRDLVLRCVGDQITGLVDGAAVIGPITNTAIPPAAGQRAGRRSASAKASNAGLQQTFQEGKNVSV